MNLCNCGSKTDEIHKVWCNRLKDAFETPISGGGPDIASLNDPVRTFNTGATRDADDEKIDFEGFLSPWAIRRYGEYMHSHKIQADGKIRDSDNWQKGIPIDQYMKSLLRHTLDAHAIHRGLATFDTKDDHEIDIEEALCAVIFNAMGFLHEHLKNAISTEDLKLIKGAAGETT